MKHAIILTSTTEHLLKSLQKMTKIFEFILPEKNKDGKRFFPDGEIYMRIRGIKNLKDKRVVVLHSGAPKPNDGLMELKLLLHILKDHEIRPELFFTYFPYGQQDKKFQAGEGNVSENLIKKFTRYYGVRKIYAIDPHFGKNAWVKKYPVVGLTTTPHLINKAKEDFGSEILFLSPDKGGKRRTGIKGLKKKRADSFNVDFFSPEISLKGKIIGVVDDLLETGGTLTRFHEVVKKSGAKEIVALVTHGVLNSGIKRVQNTFSKIYLTNTVNKKNANVDITDIIIHTFEDQH